MQESTEGFEAFVRIVHHGSISAAARALGMPRETLGRQLARLEDRLGVRLLHRGPRRLVLTPAGQTLFARAEPLVAAAREAEAAVRALDDVPRGRLRVSVPGGTGGATIMPLVLGYMQRHPEVRVELLATNRYVDLIAESVDVALRAARTLEPSLIARRLWRSALIAVATPAYLERHGRPATLADLAGHRCIVGMAGAERPAPAWPLLDGGELPITDPWLVCNAIDAQVFAVRAGAGIGVMPRALVERALARGHLEPILPDRIGGEMAMSVVYVERAFMPPKVRAFVDHAVEWSAAQLASAIEEQVVQAFDPSAPGGHDVR